MSDELQNQLQTAIEIGMERGVPKQPDGLGVPYAVIPREAQLVNLEELLPQPAWKRGSPRFNDLPSFARYVEDHRTAATAIFGENGQFKAFFDYHQPGEDGKAGWKAHSATLAVPQSPEWIEWCGSNRQWKTQVEFAAHIDRNIADIVAPAGADLLELTGTLQARVMTEFGAVVRAGATEKQGWNEVREVNGGPNNVRVPERIRLGLPVFKGWPRYSVDALLRVDIQSKHLRLMYDLLHPDKVLDAAIEELTAEVAKATRLAPLMGRAE